MQVMGYETDTVMPMVVITDVEGKILFADLTDNYRVRSEPITFTRVLDDYLTGSTLTSSSVGRDKVFFVPGVG